MLKKIIFAGFIFSSVLQVANANPAPYVGASLGIVTNTPSGSPANFRGVPFSVFAGFGGVINQNFYLAGEATGTLATGEITSNGGVKTSYGYGASVLPGFMLSDHTLAFARVGVVRARFSNVNSMSTGGQFGLGLQTLLTQNVDLRGEYDFNAYRKVSTISAPRADAFNLGIVYKFD